MSCRSRRLFSVPAFLICALLLALALASCISRGARIRSLLAGANVDQAISLARRAAGAERQEAIGLMLQWASDHAEDQALVEKRAMVFLAAAKLDPSRTDAYENLSLLTAEYPELARYADEGYAAWQAALSQSPERAGDPAFTRAGAILAAAADPERSDVLVARTKAGQLTPGLSRVMFRWDDPDLLIDRVFGAAGGWLVATADPPEGSPVGCVVSTADSTIRWLLDGPVNMSISPTGRWVAWTKLRGAEIRLLSTETGASRLLAEVDRGDLSFQAAWSPDEECVAVPTRQGLRIIWLETGEGDIVVPEEMQGGFVPWHSQWLDGGRQLGFEYGGALVGTVAYVDMDLVRVLDVASGSVSPLHFEPVRWSLGGALWSPDGKRLACDIGPDSYRWVQVTDLTSGANTLVTVGQVSSRVVGWSPDSSRLLLLMDPLDAGTESAYLWIYDVSTGKLTLVSTDCFSAVWGHDGVVYWRTVDAQSGERQVIGAIP